MEIFVAGFKRGASIACEEFSHSQDKVRKGVSVVENVMIGR